MRSLTNSLLVIICVLIVKLPEKISEQLGIDEGAVYYQSCAAGFDYNENTGWSCSKDVITEKTSWSINKLNNTVLYDIGTPGLPLLLKDCVIADTYNFSCKIENPHRDGYPLNPDRDQLYYRCYARDSCQFRVPELYFEPNPGKGDKPYKIKVPTPIWDYL